MTLQKLLLLFRRATNPGICFKLLWDHIQVPRFLELGLGAIICPLGVRRPHSTLCLAKRLGFETGQVQNGSQSSSPKQTHYGSSCVQDPSFSISFKSMFKRKGR